VSDLEITRKVVSRYVTALNLGLIPNRRVIEPSGLMRPGGANVTLQESCAYYLGASSYPDFVILTNVTDDQVAYESHPFNGKKHILERWIAADLIERGTRQGLQLHGAHLEPSLKQSMESLLRGGKGTRKEDLNDYRPVTIRAVAADSFIGQDLWRAAEEYGDVGGEDDDKMGMIYEISTSRRRAEKMKNDRRFKILKVDRRNAN
jgi:hypothetical protein